MGRLQEEANRFRRAMNDRDTEAVNSLLLRYREVWEALLPQAKDLTRQIEERRREGKEPSKQWLYRQERYTALMQQIGVQIEAFAQFASVRVRQEIYRSLEEAQADAFSLLDTATGKEIGTWNRLPIEALNELLAVTETNGPISALFRALPAQTQTAARLTLLAALAQGHGPAKTTRLLQKATGISATRAATIARTESLRAYRAASLETYRANDDVVTGWMWLAALSQRTCPVCLALHGKRFALEVDFGAHPNCRCTCVPITEPGQVFATTGEDWFREQDAETQRHILGNAKYEAYQRGEITLNDLVGEREDKTWGLVRFEKSLKEAL